MKNSGVDNSLPESPEAADTGLASLKMHSRIHQVSASAREFGNVGQRLSRAKRLRAARKLNLKAKAANATTDRIARTPQQASAAGNNGGSFIVALLDKGQALIREPRSTRSALQNCWTEPFLSIYPEVVISKKSSRYCLTCFIPPTVKHLYQFREILFVFVVLQIFSLLSHLAFKVGTAKKLIWGHHA
ncbi:hypothetical protein [Pseudomonas sp. Z4-20]|uniref:hypothetical protein n=1 Tax=Pseudomonas sp. Z4-20 TaxID=2817414 RepID=UPI003DAA00B7